MNNQQEILKIIIKEVTNHQIRRITKYLIDRVLHFKGTSFEKFPLVKFKAGDSRNINKFKFNMKFLKVMKLIKKIFNSKNISSNYKDIKKDIDKYQKLSNLVKESRINKNLSQEDLSKISKIPLSIIIAIENNQKDLIPEYPFIRSILIKLEECLSLRKFKLVKLVKKDENFKHEKIKIRYLTNKLDLFNSWQGNIIYIFILLLSLLILNNYFINLKTIEFKFIENSLTK